MKRLLTVKEFCEYTGFGKTKAYELARSPNSHFTVRLGNKIFFDKERFDDYLEHCEKYNIAMS